MDVAAEAGPKGAQVVNVYCVKWNGNDFAEVQFSFRFAHFTLVVTALNTFGDVFLYEGPHPWEPII